MCFLCMDVLLFAIIAKLQNAMCIFQWTDCNDHCSFFLRPSCAVDGLWGRLLPRIYQPLWHSFISCIFFLQPTCACLGQSKLPPYLGYFGWQRRLEKGKLASESKILVHTFPCVLCVRCSFPQFLSFLTQVHLSAVAHLPNARDFFTRFVPSIMEHDDVVVVHKAC